MVEVLCLKRSAMRLMDMMVATAYRKMPSCSSVLISRKSLKVVLGSKRLQIHTKLDCDTPRLSLMRSKCSVRNSCIYDAPCNSELCWVRRVHKDS